MINSVFPGNVYPSANAGPSASLGIRAGAASAFAGSPVAEDLQTENAMPSLPSLSGIGVLAGGATLIVLLLVLMFVAHRIGEQGDFKNVKVSFYNALVIGLAAVITIPLFKLLFTKIQIPGVSHWVAAV